MTNQDWDKIKENWGSLTMSTELLIDGYNVKLVTVKDEMKLRVLTFVDEKVSIKWCHKDDEGKYDERAVKFFQKHTKAYYSAKEIKAAEKAFGKRFCKERSYYDKHEYYDPAWTSFNSFKRHILKNNKEIKLIRKEELCTAKN